MIALALVLLAADYPVRVVDCYDGDTCRVEITEPAVSVLRDMDLVHREALRLCNVDAPELRTTTLEAAKRSRDTLLGWVRAARVLMLRNASRDGKASRDKYGRLLGWLVADGVDLSARLVAEGLAVKYLECAP